MNTGQRCGFGSLPVLKPLLFVFLQILGMAFSMTLFQQIHRTGKKYDA